tara:strand:+ start:170 stop:487 length:318 start_codon:yes stop_codon:yes gene_type:complete
MSIKYLEQKKLHVEFDTTELNSQQIRLIKSICTMLNHILTTDDECDYFDGSAEMMRMVASAVKQANFTAEWCENENIPYAQQALEFCIDSIADQMNEDEVTKYDN